MDSDAEAVCAHEETHLISVDQLGCLGHVLIERGERSQAEIDRAVSQGLRVVQQRIADLRMNSIQPMACLGSTCHRWRTAKR